MQGLTSAPFRPSFEEMLSTLRSEGQYIFSWRVLNTADYGIPQNRPRLYIIGMRCSALPGGKMGFKWPQKRECVQLSSLLDPSCVIREQPGRGTVGDKNLKQLKKGTGAMRSDQSFRAYCVGHCLNQRSCSCW